jgi:DNA replication protein DnaC
MIITTNKAFGQWSEIMSDEAVASATLDRFYIMLIYSV